MIGRMVCSDNAGHWFTEGCIRKVISLVREYTPQINGDFRNNAVGGIPSEIFIAVACGITAWKPHRRLQYKLFTRLKSVFQMVSYFHDYACKLMTGNRRTLADIIRYTLVILPQKRCLVRRQTDTV